MKTKPRVAVLYGGNSSEREISCLSGRAVASAFSEKGYDVASIDVRNDFLAEIKAAGADVAFLALHGEFGEDGQIQAILQKAGVPYTGSGPEASRIAMDKPATKRLLIANQIPTPKFYVTGVRLDEEVLLQAAEKLGYPLVVKPPADGSSLGVSIVADERELADAVCKARKISPSVMMEQYIAGRELTVGVLNGRPLPPVEIRCDGFYDFNNKYTAGRTEYLVDPELPPIVANALNEVALGTYACLGCSGAARVDVRLDESSVPYVLEVNTIPGLTATSLLPKAAQAAGIGFERLCEMMIKDALAQHENQSGGTRGEEKASA